MYKKSSKIRLLASCGAMLWLWLAMIMPAFAASSSNDMASGLARQDFKLTVKNLSTGMVESDPLFGCWRLGKSDTYEVRIDYDLRQLNVQPEQLGLNLTYTKTVDFLDDNQLHLIVRDDDSNAVAGAVVQIAPAWHSYTLKLTDPVRLYTDDTPDGKLVSSSLFKADDTLWLKSEDMTHGYLTFTVEPVGTVMARQIVFDLAIVGVMALLIALAARHIFYKP